MIMSIILFLITIIILGAIFFAIVSAITKTKKNEQPKKEEYQVTSEEIKSLEKKIQKSDNVRYEKLNRINTNNKTKNSNNRSNNNNVTDQVLMNGLVMQSILYSDDENEKEHDNYREDDNHSYKTYNNDDDNKYSASYESDHQSYSNDSFDSGSSGGD
jgi:hypothetical protein